MRYLDRLKTLNLEKRSPNLLSKPPKAPFDSFGSAHGRHFQKIDANTPALTEDVQGSGLMDAARLLADLRAQGFELILDGKTLIVRPESRLTGELKDTLRRAKPYLLVCLQAEDLREYFEERAAILEYEGNIPRAEAEASARASTGLMARNLGLPWAALRLALCDNTLPDSLDPVDKAPYGLPTWCLDPSGRPCRQGVFATDTANKHLQPPARR